MKKILTISMVLALSMSTCFAANALTTAVKSDLSAVKSAVKSDVSATKSAVKSDIKAKQEAQNSTAAAKKQEKIKQIDSKLAELNKEMKTVKEDKTITETQRTLQVKTIQRQIDFYNKQKAALK